MTTEIKPNIKINIANIWTVHYHKKSYISYTNFAFEGFHVPFSVGKCRLAEYKKYFHVKDIMIPFFLVLLHFGGEGNSLPTNQYDKISIVV